jgi:hypothetical protein
MRATPNVVLKAILSATPVADRAAVCAAWDGLLPERREFLSTWSPTMVAGWLRRLLDAWDDAAPLNTLPEGGYARRVAITDAAGERHWVWCRVATASATSGELIPCEEQGYPGGARIAFELQPDGQATATVPALQKRAPHAENHRY